MRLTAATLTFAVLVLALPQSGKAEGKTPVLIGVRENEAQTAAFAKRNGLPIVPTEAREYESGSTFVRLGADVSHSDVLLLLPDHLAPDQLMEALIKVRTASTNGAKSVTVIAESRIADVVVQGSSGERIALKLEELFASAGARFVKDRGGLKKAHFEAPLPRLEGESKAVVVDHGHSGLSQAISERLGVPLVIGDSAGLKHAQVYLVSSSNPRVNEMFLSTLSRIQDLKQKGARVHLVTPYLPYARSDKVDLQGTTVTGRLVADLIESSGADAVTFVRAHAPQSQGFFRIPSYQISGRPTISNYLRTKGVEVVVSPDAGFQKDATRYAEDLGLPVSVINKTRDPVTTKIETKGISGAEVQGKVVAIVDDETASGSTLVKAARLLKEKGATKVYAVVTHMSGTGEAVLSSGDIEELVVTDTLPLNAISGKIKKLSIAGEIAENLQLLERTRKESPSACILHHVLAGLK